jgi:hypothetical protein
MQEGQRRAALTFFRSGTRLRWRPDPCSYRDASSAPQRSQYHSVG